MLVQFGYVYVRRLIMPRAYQCTLGHTTYRFSDLKMLLAKATPARSGDELAGIAATERGGARRAQMALADVPLKHFLDGPVDPVRSRTKSPASSVDSHDAAAFAPVAHLTVGEFRDWLLDASSHGGTADRPGSRHHAGDGRRGFQDHARCRIWSSWPRKCRVVTRFRTTIGLAGPALHSPPAQSSHRRPEGHRRQHPRRPLLRQRRRGDRHQSGHRQSAHRRNAAAHAGPHPRALRDPDADLRAGACHHADGGDAARCAGRSRVPVDRRHRGRQSLLRRESRDARRGRAQAARELRADAGENVMYFETGQGSALSANAHHGVDQQTCEARAYAVARRYRRCW